MATLELHLNGSLFQVLAIEMPKLEGVLFKERVCMNEWLIKSKIQELKALYWRQIDMVKSYEIVLNMESKLLD